MGILLYLLVKIFKYEYYDLLFMLNMRVFSYITTR